MARDETPPFARGETFYNGGTIDANDPLGLGGVNLEGKEFVFEPNSNCGETGYNLSIDPNGRPVRVKVVRNRSGVALKPARVVHYDETAATAPTTYRFETGVDGYTYQLADKPAGVVDEYLPAAGVPANDLFYVVIDGPTSYTNKGTAATILRGSVLVPAAGTSRTNDDSGRVDLQDLTGATATLAENIVNRLGQSEVANSTNNSKFAGVVHRASR